MTILSGSAMANDGEPRLIKGSKSYQNVEVEVQAVSQGSGLDEQVSELEPAAGDVSSDSESANAV